MWTLFTTQTARFLVHIVFVEVLKVIIGGEKCWSPICFAKRPFSYKTWKNIVNRFEYPTGLICFLSQICAVKNVSHIWMFHIWNPASKYSSIRVVIFVDSQYVQSNQFSCEIEPHTAPVERVAPWESRTQLPSSIWYKKTESVLIYAISSLGFMHKIAYSPSS